MLLYRVHESGRIEVKLLIDAYRIVSLSLRGMCLMRTSEQRRQNSGVFHSHFSSRNCEFQLFEWRAIYLAGMPMEECGNNIWVRVCRVVGQTHFRARNTKWIKISFAIHTACGMLPYLLSKCTVRHRQRIQGSACPRERFSELLLIQKHTYIHTLQEKRNTICVVILRSAVSLHVSNIQPSFVVNL